MPDVTDVAIGPDDRGLAAMTHLSGLAGYIIPLGGVLVPIIIWMTKQDSPVISAIARQAILLNVTAYLMFIVGFLLLLTVILFPLALVVWLGVGIAAIALPVVGAVKASSGVFYRYPVVGSKP
jgi:uncharacterized Tic20 family protein